jgi:hypothetical protein
VVCRKLLRRRHSDQHRLLEGDLLVVHVVHGAGDLKKWYVDVFGNRWDNVGILLPQIASHYCQSGAASGAKNCILRARRGHEDISTRTKETTHPKFGIVRTHTKKWKFFIDSTGCLTQAQNYARCSATSFHGTWFPNRVIDNSALTRLTLLTIGAPTHLWTTEALSNPTFRM